MERCWGIYAVKSSMGYGEWECLVLGVFWMCVSQGARCRVWVVVFWQGGNVMDLKFSVLLS